MTSLLLLTFISPHIVAADASTPAKMRLLRYEGDVEIEDASGKQRDVAEDEVLNSGDLLKTDEDSSVSIALDDGRIITLDEKSKVEFQKQDGAVEIEVKEGGAFLDVSKKLSSAETMDIKVSGVTVGIRGTIVFVENRPITDELTAGKESVNLEGISPEKGQILSISQIGVLEGVAQISYTDDSSSRRSVSVEAGKKATLPEHSEDAEGISQPAVSDLTKKDIEGFVLEQVTHDLETINRVQEACDVADDIDLSGLAGIYTADGDWTWDSPVTLVAQSASKYYDGQPLTRTSDILVNGLPNIFSVKASAGGSRTDAGESDNPVSNYAIYNKAGEDVTRHFTKIETVSGTLLVVPAPLTIHTGTAEKVYDGTPLTDPDAYVTFYKGSGGREVPWRNTAYVVTESAGSVSYDNQTLYGTCGVTWVNAANPLTGERREIQLKAGQKLTVFLSDLEGRQSIELKIENLTENDLPEELLRLYADNPSLLEQACKDTSWNVELLQQRIDALPKTPSGAATIDQGGLKIRESESDRLMQDLTSVRITVDTEVTDYNNRALGSEEVHYTGLAVDESIKVTPTGSQTGFGSSINTYTIDWGTANRSNYEVGEDLGTLTVTPASITVTTGSAEKEYDGTPLTNSEASISGLVNGETATVKATGSITEVGRTDNTYSIIWDTAESNNYSISENLGTLQVMKSKATVILTSASAKKTYNGTPLTNDTVTVEGLPSGFTVSATVSGSQTDAGSSENTIETYTIYDTDGNDVTDQFRNVTTQAGTLKVTPKEITITTGSAEKEYDGTPLTNSEASITGLVEGETAKVKAIGSITEVGSTKNTYAIIWSTAEKVNYRINESLGTLRVTAPKPAITLTAASAEKTYDGTPLTDDTVTVEGLPSGFTVSATVSGSQTDAGSSDNVIDSYTILDADGNDVTVQFSNVTTQNGTLTVKPLSVVFDVGFNAEDDGNVFEYDGLPYLPEWITASYEGVDEPVEPVDWDTGDETAGTYSFTFTLPGNASLQLNGAGYTDAGSYTFEPESTFLGGKKDNYEISFTSNAIEITPAPLTITASASKEYDSQPLNGSDAVKVEGLAERDSIAVTATGTITNAGTADNPYTIGWGDTNPNNYTVTQEPGILEVTAKKVTITTGSKEKVYDGETLFYNNYELTPSDPWVNGKAPQITVTGSRTIVGESQNTCNIAWKGVNPYNYEVKQKLGTLSVKPVEIVLVSNCTYTATSELAISAYGLSVQVNNVDSSSYSVIKTDENEWRISFSWGDMIDVSTFLIKDDTSFAITPIHDFASGDPGNYSIDTTDQEGEFDYPPIIPEEGFGLGTSSTPSEANKRSLTRVPETTEGAPADENDDDFANTGDNYSTTDAKVENNEVSTNTPDAPAPDEPAPVESTQEETSAKPSATDPVEETKEEPPVEEPREKPLEEETQEEPPEKAEGESSEDAH